jgi:MoaA/NifB/PqqE/SkfB family radical SAM enzyme
VYSYAAIRKVHLEITDKCNAACPQCARNDMGGQVNPRLPLVELTLSDIKRMFPGEFLRQLTTVWCAGTYGDAIMARDTLEIFRYFRETNPSLYLGLHTNGGARSAEWWASLGRLIPRGRGYVRFGIDGLEDTNHLHRRHTTWRLIMRNVRAFIGAGGNAEWDFLVFKHNEHQVDQARDLAKELGFTLFNAKATSRFFDYGQWERTDRSPVKDAEGRVVYFLERSTRPEWDNSSLHELTAIGRRQPGGVPGYLDQIDIECRAAREQSVSISAEGFVLACCWLGSEVHKKPGRGPDSFRRMIEAVGGWDAINAKTHGIKAVIEGPFFQKLLPSSWAVPSIAKGRVFTCALVCGRGIDPSSRQSKRQEVFE